MLWTLIKMILIIGVLCCAWYFFAKKTGRGCEVCIHGKKDGKHSGLCTLVFKDEDKKH
jgi:hypothetical protein